MHRETEKMKDRHYRGVLKSAGRVRFHLSPILHELTRNIFAQQLHSSFKSILHKYPLLSVIAHLGVPTLELKLMKP
jgi:hypothetical protein